MTKISEHAKKNLRLTFSENEKYQTPYFFWF